MQHDKSYGFCFFGTGIQHSLSQSYEIQAHARRRDETAPMEMRVASSLMYSNTGDGIGWNCGQQARHSAGPESAHPSALINTRHSGRYGGRRVASGHRLNNALLHIHGQRERPAPPTSCDVHNTPFDDAACGAAGAFETSSRASEAAQPQHEAQGVEAWRKQRGRGVLTQRSHLSSEDSAV